MEKWWDEVSDWFSSRNKSYLSTKKGKRKREHVVKIRVQICHNCTWLRKAVGWVIFDRVL